MLKKLLNLLSDSVIYGLSSALSQIIAVVLLPVYTLYLTPSDLGLAAMLATVSAFFGPLGRLGIITAIFRRFNLEKSEEERGRVLSAGLWSVTISSLLLLGVCWIFAGDIAKYAVGDPDSTSLLQLSMLTAACNTVAMVPLAEMRARRRVKTTAAMNILKLLAGVACTLWLLVIEKQGVRGLIVGGLISEVVGLLALLGLTARTYRMDFGYATWKPLVLFGLPTIPHQLQGLGMTMLGQYAVGKMLGFDEAGIYSMAIRFTVPIAFVVNSVQTAWTAYKFEIHANDDDPASFFRTAVTYYVAGIMYLWVGVSFWGPELVWLMTEPPFFPAAGLIAITGLIPVSQGIYFMLGTGMELGDNLRPLPVITFFGLLTAIVSVLVLIPLFGAAGAAMASVNSFIVLTVFIYYFSQRRFRIVYDWPALIALTVLAATATLISQQTLGLPVHERLAVSIAASLIFPCLEFAVLSRSNSERHRMRLLWEKVARVGGRKTAGGRPV